uniref:Uncharacterized protein n=1 Tax=Haptolina brevifila TaxID=156173 RepID=A0A7S2CMH1_9EUKA|mmetsp:Transcript_26466/g.53178  ORF Transcript_26466/g.53178 Transcript_26466/m.53178 type:complete len:374 (+) Transcript_26466:211-1332(+)
MSDPLVEPVTPAPAWPPKRSNFDLGGTDIQHLQASQNGTYDSEACGANFTILARPPGTGLGNRLAVMLVASAIGAALNQRVTVQWSLRRSSRKGGITYNMGTFLDACQMPSNLDFVDGPVNNTTTIVLPDQDGATCWWFPEVTYASWAQGWKRSRDCLSPHRGCTHRFPRPAACNVDEALFAMHFARAQAAVQPRIPLFNPPPRHYLALHVRRGNRFGTLALKNETLPLAVSINSLLPWMLVTEVDDKTRESYEEQMQAAGLTLFHPPPVSPNTSLASLPGFRDFFALHASCGVLVDATEWGGWVDSSFSSVAALAGGAPILLPQLSTHQNVPTILSAEHKYGLKAPIRHVFFADNKRSFIEESRAVCRSGWL